MTLIAGSRKGCDGLCADAAQSKALGAGGALSQHRSLELTAVFFVRSQVDLREQEEEEKLKTLRTDQTKLRQLYVFVSVFMSSLKKKASPSLIHWGTQPLGGGKDQNLSYPRCGKKHVECTGHRVLKSGDSGYRQSVAKVGAPTQEKHKN